MAAVEGMRMHSGRVFKDPYGQINSIDFHRSQDFLVAGHEEGKITLYNTHEGKKLAALDCSKYGVANVTYTHYAKNILHSSTKDSSSQDPKARHAIRYLSFHDHQYLKFFTGHTMRVSSIGMSAKTDQFLSGGLAALHLCVCITTSVEFLDSKSDGAMQHMCAKDKRVYVWDLRTQHAQASLEVPGQPHVAMDEEGLVFAVAANGNIVSLFDARSYQHGPFLSFPMPTKQYGIQDLGVVTSMKFSCHQQHLMVCTANRIFLMDTFQGKEIVHWNQGTMDGHPPMEASFSPDGKHIISGGEDRCIYVWDCPPPEAVLTPDQVQTLQVPISVWPSHPGVPVCAKFSPTRNMAVTACHALVMWIPKEEGADGDM